MSLIELTSATTASTIATFTWQAFNEFCTRNDIQHLTTAPFHPASNGTAERFVRTFKEAFNKIIREGVSVEKALYTYLSTYRCTPNPETKKSPAELLHGRQPRIILQALFPKPKSTSTIVNKAKFAVNNPVIARNFSRGGKWLNGTIKEVLGSKMFIISTVKGDIRRHQNQIRLCQSNQQPPKHHEAEELFEIPIPIPTFEMEHNRITEEPVAVPTTSSSNTQVVPTQLVASQSATPRRSQRIRKPRQFDQSIWSM